MCCGQSCRWTRVWSYCCCLALRLMRGGTAWGVVVGESSARLACLRFYRTCLPRSENQLAEWLSSVCCLLCCFLNCAPHREGEGERVGKQEGERERGRERERGAVAHVNGQQLPSTQTSFMQMRITRDRRNKLRHLFALHDPEVLCSYCV